MYAYLNTETNRKMSKLLYERGCVSESDAWYRFNTKTSAVVPAHEQHPLYTLEDVLHPDNAKNIFGTKARSIVTGVHDEYILTSHTVMDIYQQDPTGPAWMEYVIDSLLPVSSQEQKNV